MLSEIRDPSRFGHKVARAPKSPDTYSIREALDDRRSEGMRGIVLGEGPDPEIRNNDAVQRSTLRGGKRQQHSSAHRNWTLC